MKKHNSVLFVGSPYWCERLTELMNGHQLLDAYTVAKAFGWVWRRHKTVCFVGLGAPSGYKRATYHLLFYLLEQLRIIEKRVIYWIGSDTLLLKEGAKFVRECRNIAGSSWLAKEVEEKGFRCLECMVPVKLSPNCELDFPTNGRLQILSYIPDRDHELHGSAEVRALVERFVDVDFVVIGGVGTWWQEQPNNISFLGWVDDRIPHFAHSHIVLRRTSHDSLSAFVREGLVSGRYVISTHNVPGVIWVKSGDVGLLIKEIDRFRLRFEQGTLRINRINPQVREWLTDIEAQLVSLADALD